MIGSYSKAAVSDDDEIDACLANRVNAKLNSPTKENWQVI